MTSPPRGFSKLQAALLAEVRAFDRKCGLRHTETQVTTLSGERRIENCIIEHEEDIQTQDETMLKMQALQKRALLQKLAGKDKTPCRVADGLYIGAIGAARNLKALRKRGITHILNASPIVPCYFRDNPEGAFQYLTIPIYDDASVDISGHLEEANAFIEAGRKTGGVLVHCYAGQSRSAAFIMAYLISRQGMSLVDAWEAVRAARPGAQPNSGFLHQLAEYERSFSPAPLAFKPSQICTATPAG